MLLTLLNGIMTINRYYIESISTSLMLICYGLNIWLHFRYGKGFGIARHIFGEDSILNQPNSLGGMLFYCIMIGLSKYKYSHEVNSANDFVTTVLVYDHFI
jgi:hypothetical protein